MFLKKEKYSKQQRQKYNKILLLNGVKYDTFNFLQEFDTTFSKSD